MPPDTSALKEVISKGLFHELLCGSTVTRVRSFLQRSIVEECCYKRLRQGLNTKFARVVAAESSFPLIQKR